MSDNILQLNEAVIIKGELKNLMKTSVEELVTETVFPFNNCITHFAFCWCMFIYKSPKKADMLQRK